MNKTINMQIDRYVNKNLEQNQMPQGILFFCQNLDRDILLQNYMSDNN